MKVPNRYWVLDAQDLLAMIYSNNIHPNVRSSVLDFITPNISKSVAPSQKESYKTSSKRKNRQTKQRDENALPQKKKSLDGPPDV